MRKIYKIGLCITGILLIFSLLIAASYIDYKNNNKEDNSLVVVTDGLSINYIDGNKINFNGEEKTYTFSITNNSSDTLSYYIYISDINLNKDDIKYTLQEKNNTIAISESNFPSTDAYLSSFINIDKNTTHTYELKILENKHSSLKATIDIGLEDLTEETFATVIINNNETKTEATTKIGEEASTLDEGLIELNDELGKSYYFRGNISNNYVSYADLLWRIVKINNDGSVKLILNDYITESGNFYNSDSTSTISEKLDFLNTELYKTLETWYQNTLSDYEQNIAASRYCIDDSVASVTDDNKYYLGYSRLLTDYYQTSSCLGTEVTSKIGLLTADEAVFAGASKNSENTSFYLYTEGKTQSWWTMTPATSDNENITFFEISQNGLLKNESVGSFYRGIKPVINLIKKTYVTGSGTSTDPYVIKE